MLIRILGSAEPLSFAASELSRLVRAMGQAPVEIRSEARYDPALPGLWLGPFNAFPAIVPLTQAPSPGAGRCDRRPLPAQRPDRGVPLCDRAGLPLLKRRAGG